MDALPYVLGMADVRVTLSIELSLATCEKLVLLQEDIDPILRERGATPRWTPGHRLHLPLHFAEVDRSLISRLSSAFAQAASEISPFELALVGVVALPSPSVPRLLASRASEVSSAPLGVLRDRVVAAANELGVRPDRRPTLVGATFGRLATAGERVDIGAVLEALGGIPLGKTKVREVVFFESLLTPKGSHPRVISRPRLGQRAARAR